MLCGVVAVALAASGPTARERAREGDRRGRRGSGGPSGRGWGGPRLRCGRVGLEGAAARATHGDESTAGSEATEARSEPREPSRLGLPSRSLLHRSLIYHSSQRCVRLYKNLLDLTLRNTRPRSIAAMAVLNETCVGVERSLTASVKYLGGKPRGFTVLGLHRTQTGEFNSPRPSCEGWLELTPEHSVCP